MDTNTWRSTIWQKLFTTNNKAEHLDEKSYSRDEEEAHELLPSPAHTDDGNEDSDSAPPYTDNDNDKDVGAKVPESLQAEVNDSQRSSCASRKASWIAVTTLLVTLLVIGLVLMSSMLVTSKPQESPAETNPPISEERPSSLPPLSSTVPHPIATPSSSSTPPRHPILRHSWTALSPIQKHSYIAALQCLRKLPPLLPRMPANASAYSDYPYVHAHIGYRTHNSASFLPWHRYFLSLYEHRLRESCGYDGGIPYWDWSADADSQPNADLSGSSVFDTHSGFGGNGDPTGPVTVGRHGRCVIEGPFAGLMVLWYDVKYAPHCLSRGFRTDTESNTATDAGTDGESSRNEHDSQGGVTVKIDGSALTSSEIDKILALGSYEAFVTALEKKVHDVIPFGVGGDFETFSAPFEPLFWLHHAQLDRLWALWQQQKGGDGGRVFEYGGHKFRHSIEMAGLDDVVEMGGVLGRDVKVRELMDTRAGCGGDGTNGILCAGYV